MKKIMLFALIVSIGSMINTANTDYDRLISNSLFKGLNITQEASDTEIRNAIKKAEENYLNPLESLLEDTKNTLKLKPNDKLALENKAHIEKAIHNIKKYLLLCGYVLMLSKNKKKQYVKAIRSIIIRNLGQSKPHEAESAEIRKLHEKLLNKPKIKEVIESIIDDPYFNDWEIIEDDENFEFEIL